MSSSNVKKKTCYDLLIMSFFYSGYVFINQFCTLAVICEDSLQMCVEHFGP